MGFPTIALLLLLLFVVMVESSLKDDGFSVVDFGAVGDGKTDDSQAFQKAWKAVCGSTSKGNSKLLVPEGKYFLLKSAVEFQGPCKSSSINFQVLGNIIAPSWQSFGYGKGFWLAFSNIDGLTIKGDGVVNGKGSSWWSYCQKGNGCTTMPPLLTLNSCTNLQVSGLRFRDPPRSHISVTNCDGATISHINITAPSTSPNTDGIDVSHSTKIRIQDSVIKTGDDCIAINSGSSNIDITGVHCGPGHGISIGSLGRGGSKAAVEEVHVSHCTFVETTNAARIKTWKGGSGYARKISFKDITLVGSMNPILIDQYYCNGADTCLKVSSTSAVKISDVSFIGFTGTSASDVAVQLLCSETVGCTGLVLDQIRISALSTAGQNDVSSKCINAHGISSDSNVPKVSCLKDDVPSPPSSSHSNILNTSCLDDGASCIAPSDDNQASTKRPLTYTWP